MSEATDNWQLLIGSRVVRTGEVEDATADSSVMWLRFDGNHGRQLVAKTDGCEVLPVR